jgi:hypothetical protein
LLGKMRIDFPASFPSHAQEHVPKEAFGASASSPQKHRIPLMSSTLRARLVIVPALLITGFSASAIDEITVSLSGNTGAATVSPVTLAGDMIDNVFVPRTGNALSLEPPLPPLNLGTFDIVISPGPTLAGNAAALAAFNRAALAWEARISDPITITINADLAVLGAGILGSTSSVLLQGSYTTIRNAMVVDAADEADDTITASLPTSGQFVATIPGGTTLSPTLTGSKANLKALGFAGLDGTFRHERWLDHFQHNVCLRL